jgi:hypothetical protein
MALEEIADIEIDIKKIHEALRISAREEAKTPIEQRRLEAARKNSAAASQRMWRWIDVPLPAKAYPERKPGLSRP